MWITGEITKKTKECERNELQGAYCVNFQVDEAHLQGFQQIGKKGANKL